jgi:hypothetical protein
VAILAGLLAVAAVAVSVTPFKDYGIGCGTPIAAALHGKPVAAIGADGTSLKVLTKEEQKFFSGDGLIGLSGTRIPIRSQVWVVCRRPARGRVLLSVVGLGAAGLAVAFAIRRSRTRSPDQEVPIAA